MRNLFIWGLFVLFILSSCNHSQREHPVNFYYWKSNVSIGETEKEYFRELNSEILYMRFFDVDKTERGTFPKARVRRFDIDLPEAEYVPVVFITNRCFTNNPVSPDSLAHNVFYLIGEIEQANLLPGSNEIQIDCDWTQSTRERYFRFLEKLGEISGRTITCTIRLHQVKYRKDTGVPPVEKGYLMCYATSEPGEQEDRNSILDIALLKDYTKNIDDYPLPLDIALPLFSWAVITNHEGKIKLVNAVSEDELISEGFNQLNPTTFEVPEDGFFRGIYMNKGFIITLESISPALLKEAKNTWIDPITGIMRLFIIILTGLS